MNEFWENNSPIINLAIQAVEIKGSIYTQTAEEEI